MRYALALCLALAACGDPDPSTATADGGAGCGTPPPGLVFVAPGCTLFCIGTIPSMPQDVYITCPRDGGTPYCADTQTDPRNCGDCGHACGDCSTFGGSPRCELGQCFCR